MSWIEKAELARRLLHEAEVDLLRLGHAIKRWEGTPTARPVRWMARCSKCGETATVTVRQIGTAALAGAALNFRCSKS